MNSIYKHNDTQPLENCITQGLANSAATISKLFGGPVILAITEQSLYGDYEFSTPHDHVTKPSHLIRQSIAGDTLASILLVFPDEKILQLLPGHIDHLGDESTAPITQEALMELGNTLLNTCLKTLIVQAKSTIKLSSPELEGGILCELLNSYPQDALFFKISLRCQNRNLSCDLWLLIDTSLAQHLKPENRYGNRGVDKCKVLSN
ncbi:chemotaxis protein CheC [Sessilibacter corallicola]|uniref:CheC-like protein domain-containing protein n=1 Tax=Sessilibacter corallicola TaxID=2904075 RepID=A0ABQ0A8H5_9GAMM